MNTPISNPNVKLTKYYYKAYAVGEGYRWVPRPRVNIRVFSTGHARITWAHNGVVTKEYNSVKRVAGFLKSTHALVGKTSWVVEMPNDVR
jgi:hypothetical protein